MGKKSVILLIAILIILSVGIYYLFFGSDYLYKETIRTEYGDTFEINCISYLKKWRIIGKGCNYRLEYFDRDTKIECICDNPEFRCYRCGNLIIFRKADSEEYEGIDERLDKYPTADIDEVETAKSILLIDPVILETYLPFFYENYKEEIIVLLHNVVDEKYDQLNKYGLNEHVISDELKINSIKKLAQTYLNK